MKRFFAPFKQQTIGVINLSLPIIIIAYTCPNFLFTLSGQLICSVLIGMYVFYLNRQATRNQASMLQFVPSETLKASFEQSIRACSLDPQKINLRYGYSNEGIALAMFNTISIDPLLWDSVAQDPEAEKVRNILSQYTLPYLSPLQITRMEKIQAIFTLEAQRFVFKHELGHVAQQYSAKKLVIIGVIGMLATYTGIITAVAMHPIVGVFSIPLGILMGGITDIFLTYASNALFKVPQEKNADSFAIKYSSPLEIAAAADFFEKHQDILDAHQDPNNIFATLPPTLVYGHLNGKVRAQLLRESIQ